MGGGSLCLPHDGLQNVNPGFNLDVYTTTKLDKMETSNGIEDGIDLGNTHHKFAHTYTHSHTKPHSLNSRNHIKTKPQSQSFRYHTPSKFVDKEPTKSLYR